MPLPPLDTYRALRDYVVDLHQTLVSKLPAKVLRAGRKKLELGRIDLEEEPAHMAEVVLFDYCLYHYRKNGQTLLEKHLEENPPEPDSPASLFKEALATYRYTIFEPLGTGEGEGRVPSFDQLQGIGFTLMDEGLADSLAAHETPLDALPSPVLASGMIWLSDFAMTTGPVLPVTPRALEHIEHDLRKQLGPVDEMDFKTLNTHRASDAAATIIKHGLREGAAGALTS